MSNLEGFRRRTGTALPGRHENAPDLATDKQINYLNDLRVERGAAPLALGEARRLTKEQARKDIQAWLDTPVDPDAPPPGRDADVWQLALLFRQGAQEDGIELAKGLPVIYEEIDDLVKRYEVRDRTFRQEVDGCRHRTDHPGLASRCWYHYPPKDPSSQVPCRITWVQMIEVIMAEFWSRRWDEHALDHFRQHFTEYGQAATKHWHNLRIVQSARANPAPAVMMRRRTPGGTMDDASKEG